MGMAEVGHGMGHGDRRSEWVEVGCGMAEVGHDEVNVFWVSVVRLGFCWRVRCCWVRL